MELTGSTAVGALRVGLQIVSSRKRPVLDVYFVVRNVFGPEYEMHVPSLSGERMTQKHRSQDTFVQFLLVNLGAVRAENVRLGFTGTFRRERREIGGIFDLPLAQFAPGQVIQLFKLDTFELFDSKPGPKRTVRSETIEIEMRYDGPQRGLNWLMLKLSRLWSRSQYRDVFRLLPASLLGDYPPAEYS